MRFLASLVAACLMSAASASAAVDAGLLALLPPDTELVSGVHVSQSRLTPFGQFVISQIQAHPGDLQTLVDQTGFDPRKDVSEILMTFNGKPHDGAGLVLARGNFDSAKVKAAAIAKGATVEPYLGTDLLVGVGEMGARHAGAVAFLSPTLAVAGDREAVRYAVAHANMARPEGVNPALLAKINSISSSADAWFVSMVPGTTVLPEALRSDSSPDTGGSQATAIRSIQQSSGAVRFGDQISLTFQAQTRSDKDATSLADVIRFFASLIQMRRDSDPHLGTLASALDSMTLSTSGNSISLALSVPEKDFEQLATSLHGEHRSHIAKPAEKL